MRLFCINLARRKDKREYVETEFARMGINGIEYFSAYDTKPGWAGCRDSHLDIMLACIKEPRFCIFEDDVKFLWNKEMIALSEMELPIDWDMLSLGCSPQESLTRYSDHLFRLNKPAWCLHAYILTNQNGLIDFILSQRDTMRKIDKWFSENVYTNSRFNCFVAYPLIATQIQFQSDTCKRSDVSTIEKNYAKYVR